MLSLLSHLLPTPTANHRHNHRTTTVRPPPNFSLTSSPISSSLKSVFPGGKKRPVIRIPDIVLRINPEDVVSDGSVLDVVDEAVAEKVGIVVLNCGRGSGREVYEAACLLKSVVRDRAYLLVADRVDIAVAVNASGVLVSDQGLPAIVARNTMIDSKSESVFLPMVGRNVQTLNAAVHASSFEGADFVIYTINGSSDSEGLTSSTFGQIKIPIFLAIDSLNKQNLSDEISNLLKSGASGLVVSLEGLNLLADGFLNKFYGGWESNGGTLEGQGNFEKLAKLETINGAAAKIELAGFVNLKDKEQEIIGTVRSLLLEAINLIQRAAPLVII